MNRLRTPAVRNSLGPRKQCRSTGRTGYTLLELLIVLAVLAALAALILPAIRGPLDKSRLTAAANQVQATLAKARALAIREGTAVEVRCELGGQSLRVERIPGALLINSVTSGDLTPGDTQAAGESPDQNLLRTLTLPTGVYFERVYQGLDPAVPQAASDSEFITDSEEASDSTDSTTATLNAWSDPIQFSPEGRTENAVIEVRGQRDFKIQIQLRGLTGFATYGSPQRPDSGSSPDEK